MIPNVSVIERAFQLAQCGTFCGVHEIKDRLKLEGYVTDALAGPMLRTQLKSQMAAARTARRKGNSHTSIAGTAVVAKIRSGRAARSTATA
jgi:hypothetical protein